MTRASWRKSSYSENNPDCVELRSTLDQVRDSKNPAGPVLRIDVLALVQAIQVGEFDS
ncbi:MAG TPA: DUF397 domain-containing protein [Pseudonocardiaceae bacterium]|nr:DUF397 domain-containing protein [Pseudonocardiaceae bacterium]